MALVKQVVSVDLSGGLDTKTDQKKSIPGKAILLENAIFTSIGSIRKRNGFAPLPQSVIGGGALQAGSCLAPFQSGLLMTDGVNAYAYSTAGWLNKGLSESLSIQTRPIQRSINQQTSQDLAVHPSGITVAAWEDSSGGVRYSIIDTATGQFLSANQLLSATGTKPKCQTLGNYALVIFYDTSSNHVRYAAIGVTSPYKVSAIADLAIDPGAQVFDATNIGGQIFLAYQDTSNRPALLFLSRFLTASAVTHITGEAISTCCAIFGDAAQNVWVAYWNGTAVKLLAYNYALSAQVCPPSAIETIASIRNVTGISPTLGNITLLYEQTGSQTYNNLVKQANIQAALDVTGTGFGWGWFMSHQLGFTTSVAFRSVGLASKPWYQNGLVHWLAAYQSGLQPTYVIMAGGRIAGLLAPSLGGGLTAKSILPEVTQTSSGVFVTSYLQADLLSSSAGNVFTQTGVQQATLTFGGTKTSLEMGQNLHLTGGMLQMFDGANLVEHGFFLYPENIGSSITATGGNLSQGQYQYVVVFESMDNLGQLHRSAPSAGTIVTTSNATSKVTLTIPTLRLTNKTMPISVVVYRTQVNQAILYRLTSITSPLLNDATVDTVTYVDSAADSTITGNEQLYTTGGEVENICAPAPALLANYAGRAILVPAENRQQIWFSKQVIQGVPLEWNDAFVQTIDPRGGDVTALAQMDDKLIFFKEAQIFALVAQGPSPNGQNNDFSPGQRITADSGCANQKSLVFIPNGLMYQSDKGIYLLDRSLQVSYVGAAVEAFVSGQTVTSATVIPSTTQVRFTLSSGSAVVYDYYVNQWSVFTGMNAQDSAVFEGLHTYLSPRGSISQETPGIFTDNGNPIRLRIRTSWLSFAGLQGFQRVWRMLVLGEYRSAHKLLVEVAFDFNPNAAQSFYVDAATLLSTPIFGADVFGVDSPMGGAYPLYQFRVNVLQQRCQSIQITLADVPETPYAEGMSLSALGFEVGQKAGLYKRPASFTTG